MALQMVVLATLLSPSHGVSPILVGLACSFLFKLSFNFSLLRQGCIDTCHGIRILMYHMGQIAFGIEPALGSSSSSRRWEQALQMIYERAINVRRSPTSVDTSFHAFTTLSL
ncbi:hypothetical protein QQP08_011342 [Theobroma cacao]|nr:hypothetical protein QQP08_011342 [Theobroma cacao]